MLSISDLQKDDKNGRVSGKSQLLLQRILNSFHEEQPAESLPRGNQKDRKTYAAVAARLSKDLAVVVNATSTKNRTMKLVITPSLSILPWVTARIHNGAINITMPRTVRNTRTKFSTFASSV